MTEQPNEAREVSIGVETEKIRLQERILNENTTKTHKKASVILTENN